MRRSSHFLNLLIFVLMLPLLINAAVPYSHIQQDTTAKNREILQRQTFQQRLQELRNRNTMHTKQQLNPAPSMFPPSQTTHSYNTPTIENIALEVKPIHLATNNSIHSRRQKHAATLTGPASSLRCPDDLGEKIATKFIVDFSRDNSACPREDWLVAMAEADPFSDKLFVNLGANKGYNLAVWMNVFLPRLEITPAVWNDSLAKVLQNSGDCGVCQDCASSFAVNPQSTPKLFASSARAHLTILAADLNCENMQGIEKIVGNIPALSTAPAHSQAERLSLFTACAGLSDKPGRMTMIKCPFAHESCRLGETVGRRSESVSVPITTADELLGLLFQQLPAHSLHPHSQHHPHADAQGQTSTDPTTSTTIVSSSGEEYRPTVDILMIDTEGNDYLVLQGAKELLSQRQVRVLIFEYHNFLPWMQFSLANVKDELAGQGFECYFQGQGRLWRITGEGCWSGRYEFHQWSNVMCVQRQDIWFQALQQFVVTS